MTANRRDTIRRRRDDPCAVLGQFDLFAGQNPWNQCAVFGAAQTLMCDAIDFHDSVITAKPDPRPDSLFSRLCPDKAAGLPRPIARIDPVSLEQAGVAALFDDLARL